MTAVSAARLARQQRDLGLKVPDDALYGDCRTMVADVGQVMEPVGGERTDAAWQDERVAPTDACWRAYSHGQRM